MAGTRLSIIPSDDPVFTELVREVEGRAPTPEALQELLRSEYPQVRVVRGVTDIVERWYVYRDGRWVRS
jgi:hypothetical protein